MAIFLQRYVQATVLPLERKGSLIEMQPVIFTVQNTLNNLSARKMANSFPTVSKNAHRHDNACLYPAKEEAREEV